jgi:hypothetical protein
MSGNVSKYRQGDHVKVEFCDESSGEKEGMWVEVDYSDEHDRLVFGKLDSQQVVMKKLKVGQQLAVQYDNIRAHKMLKRP